MFDSIEDFAEKVPYIRPSAARAILQQHGMMLVDFMKDHDFHTARRAEVGGSSSTDDNINTEDLVAWLGY